MGRESKLSCAKQNVLADVFHGKSLFVPVICNKLKEGQKEASIFFIAPIYSQNHKAIAALAMEEFASDHFSTILQRGRMRQTGESYAIDSSAYMISQSRFANQLVAIGLIKHGNELIKMFDPGRNLLTDKNNNIKSSSLSYTYMARHLLSGAKSDVAHTNMHGYRDYRGVPVFGAWRWIPSMGIGVATELDEKGKPKSYICLMTDITKLIKRIEKHLKESERRYKVLLDDIGDAFLSSIDEIIRIKNKLVRQPV